MLIADNTAKMNASLFDCYGELLQPGDIVRLTGGYCSLYKVLHVMKYIFNFDLNLIDPLFTVGLRPWTLQNASTLYAGKHGKIERIGACKPARFPLAHSRFGIAVASIADPRAHSSPQESSTSPSPTSPTSACPPHMNSRCSDPVYQPTRPPRLHDNGLTTRSSDARQQLDVQSIFPMHDNSLTYSQCFRCTTTA
jgi:hypothetical protein